MTDKKRFVWLVLPLCAVALTSCTMLKAEVQDSEIDEVDASLQLPTQNITRYDDALGKLGMMLTAYGVDPVVMQCRPIGNATASQKLPRDVKQLVFTGLTRIGPKITSVDFDKDQLAVDLAINKNTMERIVPDVALRGAITEFDKKVEKEKEIEGDGYASTDGHDWDAGGSLDSDAQAVTMAMDFQVLNYKTQTTVPYVQSANRLNLFTVTKAMDFGIAFEGSGFGFNCKVKKQQGVHSGLRLLVELSLLEVLGEYYQVPYWRCIPDSRPDNDMIKRYIRQLRNDPNVLLKMKTFAYAHGKRMDLASNSLSSKELAALKQLKEEYGLDPEGENDYEFIKKMWLNLPYEKAAGRMEGIGARIKKQQEAARQGEVAAQQAAQAAQIQAQQQAEAARIAAQQAAEAARQAELQKKRTTFKFGKQDTF